MNVSPLWITHVRVCTPLLCIPLGGSSSESSSDDDSPPPLTRRTGGTDSSSDDEDPEYVPSTIYRDPVVPPSKPAHVVATITVDAEPATADFQRLLQLSSVHLDSVSDLEEVD